jgi:hypothetical protein
MALLTITDIAASCITGPGHEELVGVARLRLPDVKAPLKQRINVDDRKQ